MQQQLPLVALHLQRLLPVSCPDDFAFDELVQLNIATDGGLACARASKPYTSAITPGHTVKSGYTPSGKFRSAKFVPTKTDKRAGK